MNDYPSNLGHWERISESASAVNYGRELNMHTVVEDVCRALIDLSHCLNQAKADAWDEGFRAGVNMDLGDREHPPNEYTNPYREEGDQ